MAKGRYFDRNNLPGYACVSDIDWGKWDDDNKVPEDPVEPPAPEIDKWWGNASIYSPEEELRKSYAYRGGYKYLEKDLATKLEQAMGVALVDLDEGDNFITLASDKDTLLGRVGIEELILDGHNNSRLIITGTNSKNFGCNDGGLLVVKNATVTNQISKSALLLSYTALPLAGRVRFENCHFDKSIYLKATTEAEFINCSFFSEVSSSKIYPVWADNGNMKFINCTFTGARGIKIHESVGTTEDVGTILVDGCTFDSLAQKPGIIIGVFNNSVDNVSITIQNSRFLHCQAWDTVGSIEGVDGFYEADHYTTKYEFIAKNNEIVFP